MNHRSQDWGSVASITRHQAAHCAQTAGLGGAAGLKFLVITQRYEWDMSQEISLWWDGITEYLDIYWYWYWCCFSYPYHSYHSSIYLCRYIKSSSFYTYFMITCEEYGAYCQLSDHWTTRRYRGWWYNWYKGSTLGESRVWGGDIV